MTADPMQRAEVAALVALAEAGIRPDTQEMLVHGNALHGIRPGALRKALAAALLTREEDVRAEERERCAGIAETYWVEANYDLVGIADADMAMELCRQAAATIRSANCGGGA